MIPNITKGSSMYGLVSYLVGEGKANEHTHPHVIGGDTFTQSWFGAEELDRDAVGALVGYLDEPRTHHGTSIRAGVYERDQVTGERVRTGWKDQHVWHCSLSLPASERVVSEQEWATITTEFMDEMGFTEASGKASCRWVAIHHGTSTAGNDHVHIAASMVREDGTRWEGRMGDRPKSQKVCRDLEVTHRLSRVEGREHGLVVRGELPAERQIAARAGLDGTVPTVLADRLRTAGVASTNEAEWVRRVRADGVVVKPRFASGTEVVTGYSASLKPQENGGGFAFYGGGRLGKDLSLPRLREQWGPPSMPEAQAATAEWRAAFRGTAPVGSGRETIPFGQIKPEGALARFEAFNTHLANVPITDHAAWADAARDVSGVLSGWAKFDTTNREELRAAAVTLSRSAQLDRAPRRPEPKTKTSAMGTALMLAAASQPDKPMLMAGVLLRQVTTTATAIRDNHQAAGRLRQAQAVNAHVVERLARVQLAEYVTPEKHSGPERAAGPRHEEALDPEAALAASLNAKVNPRRPTPGKGPLPHPLGPAGPGQRGPGITAHPVSRPEEENTRGYDYDR